jgi:hypothetical protein
MQQFTCQNPKNKRTAAPLASGKMFARPFFLQILHGKGRKARKGASKTISH